MAQSSGPIAQGTTGERQFTDVMWRDRFGSQAGLLNDRDGTSYQLTFTGGSDVVQVGSNSQDSLATVAGFSHKIPEDTPEPLTIPTASTTRTDIIALRYDPAYTGLPGPVRLVRIAGTSSAMPTVDNAAPGVEEQPLWAITRAPGQALNLATVTDLRWRLDGMNMAKVWRTSGFGPSITSDNANVVDLTTIRQSGGFIWDNANNILTVPPRAGLYRLALRGYASGGSGYAYSWRLMRMRNSVADFQILRGGGDKPTTLDVTMFIDDTVPLAPSDRLQMQVFYGGGTGDRRYWGVNEAEGIMFSAQYLAPLAGASPL